MEQRCFAMTQVAASYTAMHFFFPFKHSASKSSCTAAERNCVGWRGAFSRESLFEFSMVTKGLINILGFRSRQYEFMGTNSYPLSVCLFGSKNGNMHSFFFFFFLHYKRQLLRDVVWYFIQMKSCCLFTEYGSTELQG